MTELDYLEKKVFWGKYRKQSQDKNGSEQGFWNLKKNQVIRFVWKWYKVKVLILSFNTWLKPSGKVLVLKLRPKMLSANQSCVFKFKYLLAGSISEFGFLEVDRHRWKKQAKPVILEWTCQGMLSTNQIGVFFNLQYFLTRLICNFDFLVADRYQWKQM